MRRFGWATGLIVGAMVSFWLAIALTPGISQTASDQYIQVASARGREIAAAWLFVAAGPLVAVGAALLLRSATTAGIRIGLILLIVGAAWPVARGVSNALAVAAIDIHVDVASYEDLTNSSAWLPLLVFLPVFVLAPLVLGISLWRVHVTSAVPAALWLVGAIGYVAEEANRVPATIGFAVAAVGLCWCSAVTEAYANSAGHSAPDREGQTA